MKNLLKEVLGFFGMLLLHGLVSVAYAVVLLLEFLFCLYLSYQWVYVPAAAAPGSRDGLGLLFVMLLCFTGAAIPTAILAAMQASLIKNFLPDWEPPGEAD